MKKIILFLFFLFVPSTCFALDHVLDNNNASLKGVEVQKCVRGVESVRIHVYNRNKKDIKYLEIRLTDRKNNRSYDFSGNYNVKKMIGAKLFIGNIYFTPKSCKLIKVKFKGWFDW